MASDEFYVGYAPPMPSRLAAFVKKVVLVAAVGLVAAGAVLAWGHRALEGGSFAFGERHALTGVIAERPYPSIQVSGSETHESVLLVAPGKHGAADVVRSLDGARVTLEGARIQRDGRTMIEVIPSSVASVLEVRGAEPPATADAWQAERITLRGEIVDSKCFLGVMVPGAGKTHRECASLCLRGGIPPALFVRDGHRQSTLFLLETDRGEPIGERAAQLAGTLVEITGRPGQRGGWPTLQSDPTTWTRVSTSARAP